MSMAMRVLVVSMLPALLQHCHAATGQTANTADAKTNQLLGPGTLDSPAQAAMRNLKTPEEKTRPVNVAKAEIAHPDLVTRLEEIRVYGRNEPEDYVRPKRPPLLQFRYHLASASPPMTPWQKIRVPLCLIGLCGNYGPEGIPLGDSAEVRADERLKQTTLQSSQARGTLQ